jgi:hypothetical protein
MKKKTDEEIAKEIEPYLYVRDPGVHSFEEFREFTRKFPDCSDSLILAVYDRILREKGGVSLLGL